MLVETPESCSFFSSRSTESEGEELHDNTEEYYLSMEEVEDRETNIGQDNDVPYYDEHKENVDSPRPALSKNTDKPPPDESYPRSSYLAGTLANM